MQANNAFNPDADYSRFDFCVAGCPRWLRPSLADIKEMKPNQSEGEMTLPLFVVEGLDISAYRTREKLETDLEGIDVAENRYQAYDAEGRLLTLTAIGGRRSGFVVNVGRVTVSGVETTPTHQAELAKALRNHLDAIGRPPAEGLELHQLVKAFLSSGKK